MNSADLELKVRVGSKVRNINLAKELKISPDNPTMLTKQMSTQPSMYAWVAVLHAMALKLYNTKNRGMKALYAKLDKKHRNRREDEGLKITEAIISSDVESDEEYIEANNQLIEAKYNVDILSAAIVAFTQRKDMLISVGSNLRQDGERQLRILQNKTRKVSRKEG